MTGFIAVHSGVGNNVDETKYNRVIREACVNATKVLKNGGTALDACEVAIIRLENCGNTNAGFGSNLTFDGDVECEASIMDGPTLRFGACTNVSHVRNPINLARKLCDAQSRLLSMQRIPPMIMSGTGAERYAAENDCDMVDDPKEMISSKAKFTYSHYKAKMLEASNIMNDLKKTDPESGFDTVGAICVDSHGNTAAGCSSGGLLLKLSGRVGQAATFGAGCWAMEKNQTSVATCTTGNGEHLMRTLLAKEICYDLIDTKCAITCLHETFKKKFLHSPFVPANQKLYGGALSLVYDIGRSTGELLWSHTTNSICLGYMSTEMKTSKFIYSLLPTYSEQGKSVVVNAQIFRLKNKD